MYGPSNDRSFRRTHPLSPWPVAIASAWHVVLNKLDGAYRQTDLFERWRRLMEDWAAYLADEA